jgi:hypothetical protein
VPALFLGEPVPPGFKRGKLSPAKVYDNLIYEQNINRLA